MSKRRFFFPTLSLALALYMVWALGWMNPSWDWQSYAIRFLAMLGLWLPWFLTALTSRLTHTAGNTHKNPRLMLLALGVAMLGWSSISSVLDAYARQSMIWGAWLACACLLDLALDQPDALHVRQHRFGVRGVVWIGTSLLFLLMALEKLPSRLAQSCVVLIWIFATALRILRSVWSNNPEARSQNFWALAGLFTGLLLQTWAAFTPASSPLQPQFLQASAWFVVLASHLIMLTQVWRSLSTKLAYTSIALVASCFAAWASQDLWSQWPISTHAFGTVSALIVLLGTSLLSWTLRSLGSRIWEPLLSKAHTVQSHLMYAGGMEEVADALLTPFFRAGSQASAHVYTLQPNLHYSLSQSGLLERDARELSPALYEALLKNPHQVLVRPALEHILVRKPAYAMLVEELQALHVLLAVPLSVHNELEGVWLVPTRTRKQKVSFHESNALQRVADRIAPIVAALNAQQRAQTREQALRTEMDELREHARELETQIRTLQSIQHQDTALGADAVSANIVAYSPRMREVMQRLQKLSTSRCVWLEGNDTEQILQLARFLHASNTPKKGAFIHVDISSYAQTEALHSALWGAEHGLGGKLNLASHGTLYISDFPALPLEFQEAIANLMATHTLRRPGTLESLPVNVQWVFGSYCALPLLQKTNRIHEKLVTWLESHRVEVPSLTERQEDIESLTWTAITRACHKIGKTPLGMQQEALQYLKNYPWRYGIRELEELMVRAALHATDVQITVTDIQG